MPMPADIDDTSARPTVPAVESCQGRFHRRWGHLNDVHVRALAWLIDAPDLLDPQAPRWQQKIATLDIDLAAVRIWLAQLDAAPQALHAWVNLSPMTRLGRYAEKLVAFYFNWCGTLVAHGLQVRSASGETVGEFDFLLQQGAALWHVEFATKFYLFERQADSVCADDFIGPNLADTLDAKMDKILNRQLALAMHPAAQVHLPQPVSGAQALIKGWLFYHDGMPASPAASGISMSHCQGFWRSLSEVSGIGEIGKMGELAGEAFMLLPRLSWLAPAQVAVGDVLDRPAMTALLDAHFARESMPVMLAVMRCEAGTAREIERGFVVPDDWRLRARERNQRSVLRLNPA